VPGVGQPVGWPGDPPAASRAGPSRGGPVTTRPDATTAGWLASPAGRAALAHDVDPRPEQVLASVAALRSAGLDPAQAAAVLACRQAWWRSRTRLDATGWLLTLDGVEQATRPEVARARARRFAGCGQVVDLTCGLGFDLAALAAVVPAAVGIDSDPGTAVLAAANVPDAAVGCSRAETVALGAGVAVFVDPMRRAGGRRVTQPDRWSPSLSWVLALPVADLGVKVAPGLDHALVPDDHELEVVSCDGDVVEAALYRGALRDEPGVRRRATVMRRAVSTDPRSAVTTHCVTDADLPSGATPPRPVGDYVYEPDKAVIRAGLVTAVCAQVAGWLVDPHLAYVSSDRLVATPSATGYAVDEVVPFSVKQLRRRLRERGVSRVVVKRRGFAMEPDELRRQLRLTGDGHGDEATVIVTRIDDRPVAIIARPAR
jgi:hypothetical protein